MIILLAGVLQLTFLGAAVDVFLVYFSYKEHTIQVKAGNIYNLYFGKYNINIIFLR